MSERKEEILRTAAQILENKSFAAFSYQDLADRLGIRKPSIHHHFATKESLGLALLEWYRSNGRQTMESIRAQGDAARALKLVFESCEEHLVGPDHSEVCPSGAFEIDAKALSPAMLASLRELKLEFCAWLADLLAEARQAGDISFLGLAEDQAGAICAAMQGAREAVPVLGIEFFRGVVRQLARSLGLGLEL